MSNNQITASHVKTENLHKDKDDDTHVDVHHDDHHDEHHHDPAELAMFGFWVYIMSDCLLFATLFATFAVLGTSTVGQINPQDVLDLRLVAGETALLLMSSFTFGMAMLGAYAKNMKLTVRWLMLTWLLGFGFICIEVYEFAHLIHIGAGPETGSYWSAFFGLIGTHGLHVTAGLIWMIVIFCHFKREGFSENNMVRLSMLSLFWHFLDIIWVCVFSLVYLNGAL